MTTVPGGMMSCHSVETPSSAVFRSKMAAGEPCLLVSSKSSKKVKWSSIALQSE